MAQEQGPWRRFDAFERGELLTARGLVLIVGQDLQRSLYPLAFETDASLQGYALGEAPVGLSEGLEAVS
eukprot:11164173-Lingulodinium_polyedra.AAC.1